MPKELEKYRKLDNSVRWNYYADWLNAAHVAGYTYISEWMTCETAKGVSQPALAKQAKVTKQAITIKFRKFQIKGNSPGGYNNRINKTGMFYHKPKNFPRRYFVAGDVLKRSDTEYIYRSFRCTKCNKKLAPQEQWLSHNDCTALIREHLKDGDCC